MKEQSAFPRPMFAHPDYAGDKGFPGMTMREWYAGMAMTGMNANPELMQYVTMDEKIHGTFFERLARKAFEQADAMLAESSKKI